MAIANSNQKANSNKKAFGKLGINQYGEKSESIMQTEKQLTPEETLADVLTKIRQHDEATQNEIVHKIISEVSISRKNMVAALEEDLIRSRKIAEDFFSGFGNNKI